MNRETYKGGRVVERQYREGNELVTEAGGRTTRRALTAIEVAEADAANRRNAAVEVVRTFDASKGDLQDFVSAVRVLLGVE